MNGYLIVFSTEWTFVDYLAFKNLIPYSLNRQPSILSFEKWVPICKTIYYIKSVVRIQ